MPNPHPSLLPLIGFLLIVCSEASADYSRDIRPFLKQYCLECHSREKHKGDLNLEQFSSLQDVLKHPKTWQDVVEKLALGEMPPAEKPQPTLAEREKLTSWVNTALDKAARAHAGDPGPVVLRRLSNAEFTYTVRDLTGIESLAPAKEFPADSASGEGFMNVGNSLVMSSSLLTKYLDAAKDIAQHAVLLPDGIAFSTNTSQRDWTEEKLTAIRQFYGRFTENGGGTSVNLQGIKFDTKDGGVLPLQKYLVATLQHRDALNSGSKTIADVAREQQLNAKYLGILWTALNQSAPSLILDQLRSQWAASRPEDVAVLLQTIHQWQQALWRFTTVGHIGKRDGPKSWLVPVTPLAVNRQFRVAVPKPNDSGEARLYLVVSDAGDGDQGDCAVWENPRLAAPGRLDLPLKDVRAAIETFTTQRQKIFADTAACLAAATELQGTSDENTINNLARKHQIDRQSLAAWLGCLGIGVGQARIESHLTQKLDKLENYAFVKGWAGADALSVIANSSDQHVRVPGIMKPHSVAVHPSPKLRVLIGWRSPVSASLKIEGTVQHAHPECGNGVTWALELLRGNTRQRVAAGTAQGANAIKFGPLENIAVQPGDVVSLNIGPRDGNHSCDLTAVDLVLSDGPRTWNLARDISPNILAGNPHADTQGNEGIWHFYSEPDLTSSETVLPAGSLLAKWQSASAAEEKQRMAEGLQKLLQGGATKLAKESPDTALYRQLNSLTGPLLNSILRNTSRDSKPPANKAHQGDRNYWGVDPALFGKHPNGGSISPGSLCMQAPAVLELRLPAELVEGCELVVDGKLDTGAEGSVQMQILATKPANIGKLSVGAPREQGAKSTWSDGERPILSDSPIIVAEGSPARKRIERALEDFRAIFPAALCYTKIVPIDEVVTLTLFYREDDQLRRLMLDANEAAELDRLWAELHYISEDALKLVDAFEQLWQYATQDADPSAFTPMREPIKQRAEEFKKLKLETQPAHLDAVLKFAEKAYRRPLSAEDREELRSLYRQLRAEEIAHPDAIRLALARVLVSPSFLYRSEKTPPGKRAGPVDNWELATRLSYFLWSSFPDEELRTVAANGQLNKPKVLADQSRRMLQEPRVRRLATEFACAWLHIHDFSAFDEKSERHFPTFAALREPMYEEAIRFFTDAFQHDRSVLTFFDADYTFLNPALAEHYGIPGVSGPEWQRVDDVRKFGRGGVLGLGATLSKQSGASRTSPILRGNWVAEVLLGDKLPRPPKDVPRLPEDEATETLTVRELTLKHSSDPRCYGCHARIDGYGFALEGYDAIGRTRTRDLGDRTIDTRAKVFDGTVVEGAAGLRHYLLTTKREALLHQFCRKLLGYALGRGVMLSDNPLLAEMQAQLRTHDYRFSAAVETIVRSKQFREIRGKEMLDP